MQIKSDSQLYYSTAVFLSILLCVVLIRLSLWPYLLFSTYCIKATAVFTSALPQVARIGISSSCSTWEPASCLPPTIVSEFESGVQRDLTENIFSSGGQTLHVVCSQATVPPAKRQPLDLTSQSDQWYWIFNYRVHDYMYDIQNFSLGECRPWDRYYNGHVN